MLAKESHKHYFPMIWDANAPMWRPCKDTGRDKGIIGYSHLFYS